jgi:hypothetical protein
VDCIEFRAADVVNPELTALDVLDFGNAGVRGVGNFKGTSRDEPALQDGKNGRQKKLFVPIVKRAIYEDALVVIRRDGRQDLPQRHPDFIQRFFQFANRKAIGAIGKFDLSGERTALERTIDTTTLRAIGLNRQVEERIGFRSLRMRLFRRDDDIRPLAGCLFTLLCR